jgi:hypothetical protein
MIGQYTSVDSNMVFTGIKHFSPPKNESLSFDDRFIKHTRHTLKDFLLILSVDSKGMFWTDVLAIIQSEIHYKKDIPRQISYCQSEEKAISIYHWLVNSEINFAKDKESYEIYQICNMIAKRDLSGPSATDKLAWFTYTAQWRLDTISYESIQYHLFSLFKSSIWYQTHILK